MTTKFNKDMYAKMRSKKDKPLSSIGKKGVRVMGKGPSVTPIASALPSSLVSRLRGPSLQPLQLKRSLLLVQKGRA